MEDRIQTRAECLVVLQPLGKRLIVEAGTSILEAVRRAGLTLSASCGGVGICGQCRVSVLSGTVDPPSPNEQEFLDTQTWSSATRLACETRIVSSVVIEIPPEILNQKQKLQLGTADRTLDFDPAVRAITVETAPPTLEDSRSDFRRVADAIITKANSHVAPHAHPSVAAQISHIGRQHHWKLTAFMRHHEVVGVTSSNRQPLGLAVDLGCTKIAGYLLDLSNGDQLASAGVANPQLSFGEDLISRLVCANRCVPQASQLARVVRESIQSIAEQLCREAELPTHEIADCCIVGNTAMLHLLLELPVGQLLHAPFLSVTDAELDLMARDLHFDFAPAARVHVLPSIGGFVGADHVAMIMAHDIDLTDKITVGIDIGTNTEIVLRDPAKDLFLVTSVPSGPAFEGGHVSCGMRAAEGAIEKVYFRGGRLEFVTIGNAPPLGICGSGALDLLAYLSQHGHVTRRGHLVEGKPGVRNGRNGREFVAVESGTSGSGQDIVLTQSDITELQLAKAAVYAGVSTLMELTGTNPEEIAEMVVAGAFGSYLDLRSAIAIGLLPKLPHARYLQIGNAAGLGAKMALMSVAERERAKKLAHRVKRIELKQHSIFDRLLAHATQFPSATQAMTC